jgi:hypothetical protein
MDCDPQGGTPSGRSLCRLGRILSRQIPADSGMVRRQKRQILRSAGDLRGILPGFGPFVQGLMSVRSVMGPAFPQYRRESARPG